MKKLLVCFLAVAIAFCACNKKEAKPEIKKEMGEKTTVFLEGDPFIDQPRTVSITPDSLKASMGPNVDSTAYVSSVAADGTALGDTSYIVSYSQGKVYTVLAVKNQKCDGECKAYYPTGQLQAVENYRDGIQVGETKIYRDNGFPLYTGFFDDNGICCGTWKFYKENGELDHTTTVNENTIQCGSCPKCIRLRHLRDAHKQVRK